MGGPALGATNGAALVAAGTGAEGGTSGGAGVSIASDGGTTAMADGLSAVDPAEVVATAAPAATPAAASAVYGAKVTGSATG